MLGKCIDNVRKTCPLVHNITNYVTVNDVANVKNKSLSELLRDCEGIIFDVDGVLLDSMPVWEHAGERYLREKHIEPEPGLSDIMFTMSVTAGAEYLKERYHIEEDIPEIMDGIVASVREAYFHEIPLKAGVRALLENCKKANIPMIIASSSERICLEEAFARLKIEHYFQGINTCTELQTSKKQPLIYEKSAQMMGTSPSRTLVFEDALHCILAAEAARCQVIGVYDESSACDETEIRKHCVYYVKSFLEEGF